MTSDQLEKLRAIKTFPSLVKYLRDELDWPIESDDFEELTFEYEPEELGLEPAIAVKIKEIKQLRPLASNQPWGIFFINFEPKRLPVVVLRRVLRALVVKKRQSLNKADQKFWILHDLMFISSYGEEDGRSITFAHFSDDAGGGLPTLKVIGWDAQDTPLHIDQCATELGNLRFDPELAPNQWRDSWASAFTLEHREVITTSKALAEQMAVLATKIRKRVNAILKLESQSGPIRKLHKAFQETLIHDLGEDDFADMYAQTITYGLFSARCSREADFVADNLADMVPVTNPFLKDLLATFLTIGGRKGKIDFDELGINDVVQMLRVANMEAIKRDFDDKNPEHDPVIHFYELFLKQYDAKKKTQRGVFYTPKPVVSFIVRSVHEILQKEFGLADGLADTTMWGEMTKQHKDLQIPKGVSPDEPFVQILDPATGTGTFLVEVIDIIYKTMTKKWEKEGHIQFDLPKLWNQYVPKHLLPRLCGFELMMAPYAIAHMKIGLKLFETGYKFGSNERVRIYLTNTLEEPKDISQYFEQYAPALAHEAHAANLLKLHQSTTVIVGNPPYSGNSANDNDWSRNLLHAKLKDGANSYFVADGLSLKERNPKWLNDDYVKFIRYGQFRLANTGVGILGFITNHSYLDNPTFRGMRQSLLASFSNFGIINLHGNMKKKETCPDGSKDDNVFDIQQGVAIGLFTKLNGSQKIGYANLYGRREIKYSQLLNKNRIINQLEDIHPQSPFYSLIPENSDVRDEYAIFLSLSNVFGINVLGYQTHRDEIAVGYDREDLTNRLQNYLGKSIPKHITDSIMPSCYRLFDERYTVFSTKINDRPRVDFLQHVSQPNLILGIGRQGQAVDPEHWQVVYCSRRHMDANVFRRGGVTIFPLYQYPDSAGLHKNTSRKPNVSGSYVKDCSRLLNLKWLEDGEGDLKKTFGPENILSFAYGIFHSPGYRGRYSEFLRNDFPRIPMTSNSNLFVQICKLGSELVTLHLMESPKLDGRITKWLGKTPSTEVEKVVWDKDTVWIDKAKITGFSGVPEDVWNFHIGGYQVCEKWLKDRKGRKLSKEDIEHYQKIVVALSETIKIMKQIDETIDAHGGWPKAFIVEPLKGDPI